MGKKFELSNKIKLIQLATSDINENDILDLTGYGRKDKTASETISCLKNYKVKVVNCEQNVPFGKMKVFNGVFCYKSDAIAGLPVSK